MTAPCVCPIVGRLRTLRCGVHRLDIVLAASCVEIKAPRCGITFGGKGRIVRVEEVGEAVDIGPRGASLLLGGEGCSEEAAQIGKSSAQQPIFEAALCGQEPDTTGFCVALSWHQGDGIVSRDALAVDDDLALGCEGLVHLAQEADGIGVMVEDTEAKDRVEEAGEQVGVFDAEEFKVKVIEAGPLLEKLKGPVVLGVGFKTDHASGIVLGHSKHKVAVVTADISDAFVLEGDMRGDPRPLPIGAPFGVDGGSKQRKGAFFPRSKGVEGLCKEKML